MCVRSSEPRRRNLLHFFGKRVFIAGLGDSGVLTAIKLARHADVVGISAKPALVSGPELGSRLTGPDLLAPEPIDTAKTIGLMGTTAARHNATGHPAIMVAGSGRRRWRCDVPGVVNLWGAAPTTDDGAPDLPRRRSPSPPTAVAATSGRHRARDPRGAADRGGFFSETVTTGPTDTPLPSEDESPVRVCM